MCYRTGTPANRRLNMLLPLVPRGAQQRQVLGVGQAQALAVRAGEQQVGGGGQTRRQGRGPSAAEGQGEGEWREPSYAGRDGHGRRAWRTRCVAYENTLQCANP